MVKTCDKCGAQVLDDNAKFCSGCGAEMVEKLIFCSQCGKKSPDPKARFCPDCGAELKPPVSQEKQVEQPSVKKQFVDTAASAGKSVGCASSRS